MDKATAIRRICNTALISYTPLEDIEKLKGAKELIEEFDLDVDLFYSVHVDDEGYGRVIKYAGTPPQESEFIERGTPVQVFNHLVEGDTFGDVVVTKFIAEYAERFVVVDYVGNGSYLCKATHTKASRFRTKGMKILLNVNMFKTCNF